MKKIVFVLSALLFTTILASATKLPHVILMAIAQNNSAYSIYREFLKRPL